MSRTRRALALVVCTLLAQGCTVAPLVQDAGSRGPSIFSDLPDADHIQVAAQDATVLRGVYVHATSSSPHFVVLHLLPSGASVTTGLPAGVGRISLAPAVESLRHRGLYSVIIDPRGVGSSNAQRSTAHYLQDADAMWLAALRAAEGDPARVIIRAGSLGTIAAAHLLANGARPAACILYAPVRAGTVAAHAARLRHGLLAPFFTMFVRPLSASDLTDVVAHTDVPLLLLIPEHDEYLPDDECAALAETARAAGHGVHTIPGDHATLTLRMWRFGVDTDSFSARHVPDLLPAETKFLDTVTHPTPP